MNITYKKSCPVNRLQVSNLNFDPCFKVQLCHNIEKAFISLIMAPWVLNPVSFSDYLQFCLIPRERWHVIFLVV